MECALNIAINAVKLQSPTLRQMSSVFGEVQGNAMERSIRQVLGPKVSVSCKDKKKDKYNSENFSWKEAVLNPAVSTEQPPNNFSPLFNVLVHGCILFYWWAHLTSKASLLFFLKCEVWEISYILSSDLVTHIKTCKVSFPLSLHKPDQCQLPLNPHLCVHFFIFWFCNCNSCGLNLL